MVVSTFLGLSGVQHPSPSGVHVPGMGWYGLQHLGMVWYGVHYSGLVWYVAYHPLLVWCGCSILDLSGILSTILVWLVCTFLGLSAMSTPSWSGVQYLGLVWCALFWYGLV